MEYIAYASKQFNNILASTPQNNCKAIQIDTGYILDAGIYMPGGWFISKQLLNCFMGGRGIVSFGQCMIDNNQLPTVDIAWDDPVLSYHTAFAPKNGIFGVYDNENFVAGLTFCDNPSDIQASGNIIVASPNSLLAVIFYAAYAVPFAIKELLESRISTNDILWAWGSCPIAALSNDRDYLEHKKATIMHNHASISIWLRGYDEQLNTIVKNYTKGILRLHNLTTAKTFITEM